MGWAGEAKAKDLEVTWGGVAKAKDGGRTHGHRLCKAGARASTRGSARARARARARESSVAHLRTGYGLAACQRRRLSTGTSIRHCKSISTKRAPARMSRSVSLAAVLLR